MRVSLSIQPELRSGRSEREGGQLTASPRPTCLEIYRQLCSRAPLIIQGGYRRLWSLKQRSQDKSSRPLITAIKQAGQSGVAWDRPASAPVPPAQPVSSEEGSPCPSSKQSRAGRGWEASTGQRGAQLVVSVEGRLVCPTETLAGDGATKYWGRRTGHHGPRRWGRDLQASCQQARQALPFPRCRVLV